jgi:hypothetical protein
MSTRTFAFVLLNLTLLGATVAQAKQFVLFDATFTFTKEDADNSKPSKSHYYIKGDKLNPDRPKDWTAPIDYRNGTVHIRTEVLENPLAASPPPGRCATSRTRDKKTATAAPARSSTRRRACTSRTSR